MVTAPARRGGFPHGGASEEDQRAGARIHAAGARHQNRARPSGLISYSRRDRIAKDICEELRQEGAEVWVDTESISGGEEWSRSISQGIHEAEAFVVFISRNVAKYPKSVLTELNLAKSAGKRIVPVRLKPMHGLPEGFDLFLTGVQWIDLFPPNYVSGMDRLRTAIGLGMAAEPAGVRQRAQRIKHQIRRVSNNYELPSKLRNYGGVAVGGAAIAAAVIGKNVAEQQERQRVEADRRAQLERQQYLERTSEMLTRAMSEVKLTDGMTPEEYRDDFRPAFSRILGQLEATHQPSPAVKERHDQLVAELQRLMDGFDAAARKADSGDVVGFQRAITRLIVRWAQTISSMIAWLSDAAN